MASALVMGLTACSVDGPVIGPDAGDKTPQISEDVVQGELLVRFDARVSDILDKAGLTRSGATSRHEVIPVVVCKLVLAED